MPDGYAPVKRLTASSAAVEAAQKRGFFAKPETPPPEPNTDKNETFGEIYRELRQYPAFDDSPRPLAIGIDKQIRYALGGRYGRKPISLVLAWWTRLPDYLRSVARGRPRVNLDGTVAGEVSESHRAKAFEQLKKRGIAPPHSTHFVRWG